MRLHDLRHSAASLLISRGLSLPVIGRILGHSQDSTTERYAHLHDAPVIAAVADLGHAIGGPPLRLALIPMTDHPLAPRWDAVLEKRGLTA